MRKVSNRSELQGSIFLRQGEAECGFCFKTDKEDRDVPRYTPANATADYRQTAEDDHSPLNL